MQSRFEIALVLVLAAPSAAACMRPAPPAQQRSATAETEQEEIPPKE